LKGVDTLDFRDKKEALFGASFFNMDCEKIRENFSGYINHSIPQNLAQIIEEHLCICEDCRNKLNQLLNEEIDYQAPSSHYKKDTYNLVTYLILGIGIILVIYLVFLLVKFTSSIGK